MTKREYGRRFLASPLGLGAAALSALGGIALWRAGFLPLLALLATAGIFLALGLLALITGLGPRAAALEAEREAAAAGAERRSAAASLRDRLSRLRLADPELAAARDLLVLEASRLLDAASSAKPRGGRGERATGLADFDPGIPRALEESLELVQAWLRETDESSVERRFGAPDAHPFPDAKGRLLAALAEKTALVLRLRDRSITSAPDILALDEELR